VDPVAQVDLFPLTSGSVRDNGFLTVPSHWPETQPLHPLLGGNERPSRLLGECIEPDELATKGQGSARDSLGLAASICLPADVP